MSDIAQRVKQIISEHLEVSEDKVVDSASFADDLGTDSLALVELVMKFETEFDIEIPDSVAYEITTVQSAIDYIENTRKAA